MHSPGTERAMLFDLEADPDELNDLGTDPAHAEVIRDLRAELGTWALRCAQRVTLSDQDYTAWRGRSLRRGITLGLFDGSEVPADVLEKYVGRFVEDMSEGPSN